MTYIHEVECDKCKKRAPLKYNGEHWLTPDDWLELFDNKVYSKGHICNDCNPLNSANKKAKGNKT